MEMLLYPFCTRYEYLLRYNVIRSGQIGKTKNQYEPNGYWQINRFSSVMSNENVVSLRMSAINYPGVYPSGYT